MKPAPFHRLVPASVQEVLTILDEHAPDCRLLAGGQSLVPMMNFRLACPAVIIDLNQVTDLAHVTDLGETIAVGAMTRERTIEFDRTISSAVPLLREATSFVGHLPIRSRGTIGGSLANADPAAEYPAVIRALDCQLIARSLRGERRISACDFFDGPLTTTLSPDELLTGIIIPKAPAGSGDAFVEVARRHGDFALAGVAAQVTLSCGTLTDVRLAACGVGPGPVRLAAAEAIVRTRGVSDEALEAAAEAAAAEVEPESDLHASARYRRRLAGILVKRALTTAISRAGGPN